VSFFDRLCQLYAKSAEKQFDYVIAVRCLIVANVQTTAGGGFVPNMQCIWLAGESFFDDDPSPPGISIPRVTFSDRIRRKNRTDTGWERDFIVYYWLYHVQVGRPNVRYKGGFCELTEQ